jgi:hypothetical protein
VDGGRYTWGAYRLTRGSGTRPGMRLLRAQSSRCGLDGRFHKPVVRSRFAPEGAPQVALAGVSTPIPESRRSGSQRRRPERPNSRLWNDLNGGWASGRGRTVREAYSTSRSIFPLSRPRSIVAWPRKECSHYACPIDPPHAEIAALRRERDAALTENAALTTILHSIGSGSRPGPSRCATGYPALIGRGKRHKLLRPEARHIPEVHRQ